MAVIIFDCKPDVSISCSCKEGKHDYQSGEIEVSCPELVDLFINGYEGLSYKDENYQAYLKEKEAEDKLKSKKKTEKQGD